jgi:uncharacterized protein YbaR (Trm112 family)
MSKPAPTANDLRWLVCPACRHALQLEDNVIRCLGCNRLYPIVDGIPILLPVPLKDRAI